MSGLDLKRFMERRRPAWMELERRLGTAPQGRLRRVPTGDLERLGSLYRRTASDLALARRDFDGEPITQYLNELVARAHPVLYRGATGRRGDLGAYFAVGIPRAFRDAAPYVLASLALSAIGVVAGWLAVELRPELASTLAPQNSLFDRMARGEVPPGTDVGVGTAAGIILNNMRVALVVFAGGVLVGLPTVAILLINGWTLGTLAAVEHRDGLDVIFWSYIAPHGIIELSIFVFAGATGLMLADALLRPGLLRRSDALAARAGPALGLALGLACLLVTCGLLEGLFSPTDAPQGLKYAVGAAGGTLLYAWLLLAGRAPTHRLQPVSLERAGAGATAARA